jgi:coenzyme F420-0:L-glutamate ligase / coenzyme F420-1:gamma-L-glutamate ligase
VRPGDDLAAHLRTAVRHLERPLQPYDVIVVTHKVVSKAEGCVVDLATVTPSTRANELAETGGNDPRLIEVVLGETVRLVRADPRVLVCETRHGLVCANAGVDRSNVGGGEMVTILPRDPDGSAARLRAALLEDAGGGPLGLVLTDTFGRPFRLGGVNVAIGVAGMPAATDYTGLPDAAGYVLHAGLIGSADEIAAAAELVMGKTERVPAVRLRGLRWEGEGRAADLLRAVHEDVFRAPGP